MLLCTSVAGPAAKSSGGGLWPLVEQVADALDAAHERGLVHRDVKPSMCWFDGRGHCYLADFGSPGSSRSKPPIVETDAR